MTRSQALNHAIEALLSLQKETNPALSATIEKLKEIQNSLPLVRWDDKTIRDSIEQFILDNGRVPTPADFINGMPSNTVFVSRYGVTLSQWLDKNYPTEKTNRESVVEKAIQDFILEYNRIKPNSCDDYNEKRANGLYGWRLIAKFCKVRTWNELRETLCLQKYSNYDTSRNHCITTNVTFDIRDFD